MLGRARLHCGLELVQLAGELRLESEAAQTLERMHSHILPATSLTAPPLETDKACHEALRKRTRNAERSAVLACRAVS